MTKSADRTAELLEELRALTERVEEIERELGPADRESSSAAAVAMLAEAFGRISSVGLFRADAEGNCIEVNDRWCEITGCPRERALGRGYVQALAPEYRERFAGRWPALPPGQRFRSEVLYRRPDGREVRVEADGEAELDSEGRPLGTISSVIDITSQAEAEKQRRATEVELRARLEELEVLYRNAPVGLCFMDTSLRFRTVNDRLAKINGASVEEHIGRRVEDVVPQVADQIVPVYERILRSGQDVVGLEVRGVLPSDPMIEHTWLATHHPVRAQDGAVAGIITVFQDISGRKREEETLERARAHLEAAQRVAGVGSWQWDRMSGEIIWSEEMYRIYGCERDYRPTFETFFERVHPLDRPKMRKLLDEVLETGEPSITEARILLDDGSARWVRSPFCSSSCESHKIFSPSCSRGSC